jgi:hypothetical protein
MERKSTKKEKATLPEIPETSLNADQACNEFQLVGTTRAHVLKKFKDDVHSIEEWSRMFSEQRIC